MTFQIDHDFHIHSQLSPWEGDPEQTTERILQYAVDNGLKHIVIADHFWDENAYNPYGMWLWPGCACSTKEVFSSLPLPQAEGVQFHFGVETDMDMDCNIGISKEVADKVDFIVVPTTHMHFNGGSMRESESGSLSARRERYIERWEALLDADLPFHKVGLAHITCHLFTAGNPAYKWTDHLDILDAIPTDTFKRLFSESEKRGMGIELNETLHKYADDELDRLLRVYRIAVECGCHFYRASDAHHPADFEQAMINSRRFVELLNLTEDQKFKPFG